MHLVAVDWCRSVCASRHHFGKKSAFLIGHCQPRGDPIRAAHQDLERESSNEWIPHLNKAVILTSSQFDDGTMSMTV